MRWKPLEANPEVLNDFSSSIGVKDERFSFQDVFGLDPELLMMVPTPVIAVIVLYPLTEATEAIQPGQMETVPNDLFYMKQTIGNACGTIAVLHCLGNNVKRMRIEDGSFLDRFLKNSASMSPEERGKLLEAQEDLEAAHATAANDGDTAVPGADDEINLHFVALVNIEGRLLELDGRKKGPVDHGSTSDETLLQDCAHVVRNLVEMTNSCSFSMLALCGR